MGLIDTGLGKRRWQPQDVFSDPTTGIDWLPYGQTKKKGLFAHRNVRRPVSKVVAETQGSKLFEKELGAPAAYEHDSGNWGDEFADFLSTAMDEIGIGTRQRSKESTWEVLNLMEELKAGKSLREGRPVNPDYDFDPGDYKSTRKFIESIPEGIQDTLRGMVEERRTAGGKKLLGPAYGGEATVPGGLNWMNPTDTSKEGEAYDFLTSVSKNLSSYLNAPPADEGQLLNWFMTGGEPRRFQSLKDRLAQYDKDVGEKTGEFREAAGEEVKGQLGEIRDVVSGSAGPYKSGFVGEEVSGLVESMDMSQRKRNKRLKDLLEGAWQSGVADPLSQIGSDWVDIGEFDIDEGYTSSYID